MSPIVGAHVELEAVGHLHRQRLDVHLAVDLAEDAAFLDALGVSDELHDDLRLNRLIEPDLLEIDAQKARARGVELVLLEHRVVSLLLPLEDDVEDRAGRGHRSAPCGARSSMQKGQRLRRPHGDPGNEPVRRSRRDSPLPRESRA